MEGRTRIRWDRLGRWALIGVFALVLYLYIGPAVSWVKTYREAGRQREQVADLRAENQRLKERKAELSAPGRPGARGAPPRHGQGRRARLHRHRHQVGARIARFYPARVSYESAQEQWQAGLRRLDEAYPEQQPTLERVTREIQNELRRRLGGPFTLESSPSSTTRARAGRPTSRSRPRPRSPSPGTRGSSPTPPSAATCAPRRTSPAAAGSRSYGCLTNACWSQTVSNPSRS